MEWIGWEEGVVGDGVDVDNGVDVGNAVSL